MCFFSDFSAKPDKSNHWSEFNDTLLQNYLLFNILASHFSLSKESFSIFPLKMTRKTNEIIVTCKILKQLPFQSAHFALLLLLFAYISLFFSLLFYFLHYKDRLCTSALSIIAVVFSFSRVSSSFFLVSSHFSPIFPRPFLNFPPNFPPSFPSFLSFHSRHLALSILYHIYKNYPNYRCALFA